MRSMTLSEPAGATATKMKSNELSEKELGSISGGFFSAPFAQAWIASHNQLQPLEVRMSDVLISG